MILKVCGMKDAENTRRAEALGIDMIGNIFYPGSPRYVSERELHFTPKRAKLVSVFVNPSEEQVCRIVSVVGSDYVQLHGTEPPEFWSSLRDKGIRISRHSLSPQQRICKRQSLMQGFATTTCSTQKHPLTEVPAAIRLGDS